MNQRIKAAIAIIGIILYAAFCISSVDGHDSARPHGHSEMIVVQTGAFNNITGATNDPMTNVNLQTVLDAIDNSTLPTASNIVVNTNNFGYFAPTNNTLQVLLDWQDDNLNTNIDNTNIYMTSVQSSNAFVGTGSTAFIRADGGRVSNQHLSANAVNSSNITDAAVGISDISTNYFKMPRASGFTASSGDAIGIGANTGRVMLVTTTQVSRTTLINFWAFLSLTNASGSSADPLSLLYAVAQVSSNGTVWSDAGRGHATVAVFTNFGAGSSFSMPANMSFFVPAGQYYQLWSFAGSSLALHERWTCSWATVRSEAD